MKLSVKSENISDSITDKSDLMFSHKRQTQEKTSFILKFFHVLTINYSLFHNKYYNVHCTVDIIEGFFFVCNIQSHTF